MIEGKRTRGTQKKVRENDIKKRVKCDNIGEAKQKSASRNAWRKMVHNLRIEDVTY